MSNEMIERVARALYESPAYQEISEHDGHSKPAWTDAHPLNQEDMRTLARAAMEAMRDPTEVIRVAYYSGLRHYGEEDPDAAWAKLIDAALGKQS